MVTRWPDPFLDLVEFRSVIDSKEADLSRLVDVLSPYGHHWPERAINITGYVESGSGLLASRLNVAHYKGGASNPDDVHVHFHLSFNVRVPGTRGTPSRASVVAQGRVAEISHVLGILAELGISSSVRGSMVWEFPSQNVSPIVPLPFLNLGIPGTEFGRVNGVRFGKHSDAGVGESVILDLIPQGRLRLIINFDFVGGINPNMLETAWMEKHYLKDAFIQIQE